MSDQAPDPVPAEPADPTLLRIERRLRELQEASEIGMELIEALCDDAAAGRPAQAGPYPYPDPVDAFCKISRAIRLNIARELRTEEALRRRRAAAVASAAQPAKQRVPTQPTVAEPRRPPGGRLLH